VTSGVHSRRSKHEKNNKPRRKGKRGAGGRGGKEGDFRVEKSKKCRPSQAEKTIKENVLNGGGRVPTRGGKEED